jgi:hypothetical protein
MGEIGSRYRAGVDPVRAVGISLDDDAVDARTTATLPRDAGSDDADRTAPSTDDLTSEGVVGETHDRRSPLLLASLIALLAIPLVVAVVALRESRWYPLLDFAQTEIRVRDVASSHPPLIGLAGRIGPYGPDGGSHPGPLSFWALWPFYQLFGASSWALEAATAALNATAVGLALWIAHRRGGVRVVLGLALILALLMRAYGASLLTLPWNPYLPVLWWCVFLLAVWSLFLRDLPMLPVAVFAGSFCAQTHIPYAGLVAGLMVCVIGVLGVEAYRRRHDARLRRELLRWSLVGAALGLVLWLPPIIDEVVHEPGNLTVIREHFSHPPEPAVGIREGAEVLLVQLDPMKRLTEPLSTEIVPSVAEGSVAPGVLLIAAWASSAVVALRLRHRALVALHTVVGLALVLGFVSTARIFGFVWFYLLLWAWGVVALAILAIVWTVAELVRTRAPRAEPARASRLVPLALGAAAVAVTALFVVDAADVDVQARRINDTLGELVPPTAAALTELGESGQDGPYIVTWLPDGLAIGAQGFGMLNELDRLGFDVRADLPHRPGATRYHVMKLADAAIDVHVATGRDIDRWRTDPRYREVAYFDPRSEAERREFEELRAQVIDDMEQAGLHEIVGEVDVNLFMLSLEPRVPRVADERITRMLEIGMPAAVFIGTPNSPA